MKESKKVNWLLVGTGDIARKRVAPALKDASGSNLTAICDLNKECVQRFAKDFDIADDKVYTDFDGAISDKDVDAVYLATPIFLHVEHALKALRAGKHVLVEKPLALCAQDAQRLIEETNGSVLNVGCAYFRRFFNRYKYAKDMIRNGEFGEIVLVRMTYFSWFNPAQNDPKYWRVVRNKSGGGPLSDMGSHMFDVMIGLFGLPQNVFAFTMTKTHGYEVEDSATTVMQYKNGPDVVASFNWNSKTWTHEFEIVGTEAKLKWSPYDSGAIFKTVGRNTEQIELPEPVNAHLPMVQDFVNAIAEDRQPVVTAAEAVKTNVLLDAIYRSSQIGQVVKL